MAAAGGMAHEEIATALGIARNTLEKHFELELSTGANRRRLEWLMAMDRAARKGNVAAQKALLATTPRLGVSPVPKGVEEGAGAQPPKAPKLGKKEQAQAEAVTAARGTSWDEILPKAGQPLQ